MPRLSFGRKSQQLLQQPQKRQSRNKPEGEMNIFCCSDLVSRNFVADKLKDVKQDANIVKLEVEDLLMATSYHSLLPKVKALLIQDDRSWKRIDFIDSLCSSDFSVWQAVKQKVMNEYESSIDNTCSYTNCVSFRATVEVNEGTAKHSTISLLNSLQRDQDVKDISYGGGLYGHNHDAIPGTLKRSFDEDGNLKKSFVVHIKCGWSNAGDRSDRLWKATLQSCLNNLQGIEEGALPSLSDHSEDVGSQAGHRMQRRHNALQLGKGIDEKPLKGHGMFGGFEPRLSILSKVGLSESTRTSKTKLRRFKSVDDSDLRRSEHKKAPMSNLSSRRPVRRCISTDNDVSPVRRICEGSKKAKSPKRQSQSPRRVPRRSNTLDSVESPVCKSEGCKKTDSTKQESKTGSLSSRRSPRRCNSMDNDGSPVRRRTVERRKNTNSPQQESNMENVSTRRAPRRSISMDNEGSPVRRSTIQRRENVDAGSLKQHSPTRRVIGRQPEVEHARTNLIPSAA
ncbi:expressed unknown protein [Seminavis robusta]|uniref:Uncharacterized protein n=1 Tax=Seminavis robusta TaxID=568900 RepID=A0A9N8DHY2_9STRA|nr:expressed unknown protein [Seminavis robusta]|eukprot:Sro130_g062030.1 n/a (509) ;mRNA; f:92236-93762